VLVAFRAAFVCASLLCIALAGMVTASLSIAERAPGGGAYLGVSLGVGGAFLVLGVLLHGVHRRVVGMARELRRLDPGGTGPLSMHLGGLVVRLLVGGIMLCILLGSLAAAIARRIEEGFAIFG
jgi:hypothetical protein